MDSGESPSRKSPYHAYFIFGKNYADSLYSRRKNEAKNVKNENKNDYDVKYCYDSFERFALDRAG